MTFHEMNHQEQVKAYLERINFCGKIDGSAAALAELQETHLCAVPYENFDILRGRALSYDIADLYNKIVTDKRGGYCFELNGLYGWLLRSLGYPVIDYFARFLRDETAIPARRHRVLRVEAEGQPWLCDVGVGGVIPRKPLLIAEGLEQPQGSELYRLVKNDVLGWVVEESRHGAWSNYFSFTEEPQLPIDFTMPSYYCEHSPSSIFNEKPMVAIRTPQGRVTLDGNVFKVFSPEGVKVFTIENTEEFDSAVYLYFGIIVK